MAAETTKEHFRAWASYCIKVALDSVDEAVHAPAVSTPSELQFCHMQPAPSPPSPTYVHTHISCDRHVPRYIWNTLPLDIRNSPSICCFRWHLKKFLYNLVFLGHLSPHQTLCASDPTGFSHWHRAQCLLALLVVVSRCRRRRVL